MPDLSRSELAAYAACAVLVALLGWRALRSDAGSPAAAPGTVARTTAGDATTVTEAPSVRPLVHVVGAVQHPGVYRLGAGQRVQDAIRRAGGVTHGADTQAINLAAKVADAQQVVVPRRSATGAVAAAIATTGAGGGTPARAPVSLNTATAEQLETLDGVGPATAQKILAYRQAHGGFGSVDQLAEVPGIGPKKLEALRPQVQV